MIELLPLESIRIDGGTQPRKEIDLEHVQLIADKIRYVENLEGVVPEAIVFHDGAEHWLADGFHRFHGHKSANKTYMRCDVRPGTLRDAIIYSVGTNLQLGRTNDDKRKAVLTLLNDAEWSKWSDKNIADACGVSHSFASAVHRSVRKSPEDTIYAPNIDAISGNEETRTVTRGGQTYKMNVAKIGPKKSDPIPAINDDAPALESAADAILQTAPPKTRIPLPASSKPSAEPNRRGPLNKNLRDRLTEVWECVDEQLGFSWSQGVSKDDVVSELYLLIEFTRGLTQFAPPSEVIT